MRFPVHVRHRKQEAVIYGKTAGYSFYRVALAVAGKRVLKSFGTYGEAHDYAEKTVRELAKGDQAAALSPKESTDALAISAALDAFKVDTGKTISALEAVKGYLDAARKLGEHTLTAAVAGFLNGAATVRRRDVGEAVEEFLQAREPLTRSANGERPQLSPKFFYNLKIMLRRFADTFPGAAVCDLTKDHLDLFAGALTEFSAKTRNHHRSAVHDFLKWAIRKDYLLPTHRLGEAEGLRREHANTAEVGCYTPQEFSRLLDAADDALRPLLAIGGLAGLRTAELLRLDWGDLWRVAGHVEITSGKAKTRQRRLVEVCPALSAWLEPWRAQKSGPVWTGNELAFHRAVVELCAALELPRKANGLRHSFCSYHYALHGNENLTAQQAGNSPNMVHGHYKGLATKAEAEKWFAVAPAPVAENIIPLKQSVA
jgi:integrase